MKTAIEWLHQMSKHLIEERKYYDQAFIRSNTYA